MEKEFAPYKQALDLKELGFDEPCLAYYTKNTPKLKFGEGFELVTREMYRNVMYYPLINSRYKAGNNAPDGYYYLTTVPTFSQAFRWFREKHNIDSYHIAPTNNMFGNFYGVLGLRTATFNGGFKTYEEAELECLKKLIEIVKKKGGDK